jgi:DeoR family transcriptional regulator, aga operon transcriptional repressor
MSRQIRMNDLLDLILERGRIGVDEVVADFGVSPATARRDLDALAAEQLVIRTHGGAKRLPGSSDLPLRFRSVEHGAEKLRIAEAAAAMVADGDVVGLNGGTTTVAIAQELASSWIEGRESGQGIVVITNALNIASTLAVRPHVRVVATGGVAKPQSFELTGPLAEPLLNQVSIDLLFLGVNAISAAGGATAHDEAEAAINRLMASRAKRTVVVAHCAKVGRTAFARILPAAEIDALLTDAGADPDEVAALRDLGVEVVQV